jgi:hypothetical protein
MAGHPGRITAQPARRVWPAVRRGGVGCRLRHPPGGRVAIWQYDTKTPAWDLGGHLAYGAGTGVTFWMLANALDQPLQSRC